LLIKEILERAQAGLFGGCGVFRGSLGVFNTSDIRAGVIWWDTSSIVQILSLWRLEGSILVVLVTATPSRNMILVLLLQMIKAHLRMLRTHY